MSTPTKSQVMSWKTGALAAIATDAGTLRDAIDKQADAMNRTIYSLDWSGDAYKAATSRADREKAQQRAVATAYDDLSTALQGAERDTSWNIGQIQQTINSLPHGWSVAEDFTVTPADSADKNQADNDTNSLKNLASDLGQAMDKWAAKITDAINDISTLAPISAEKCVVNPADKFTPQQAAADLAALKNGTADADTLTRLRLASELSPDDKTALANGQTVNLPQFDYLSALSHGMNGMSASDIGDLGSKLPGNGHDQVQADIANSFRVLSDPQVHSASASPASTVAQPTGGMTQLPDQVQKILTQDPTHAIAFGSMHVNDSEDMFALAKTMSVGDKDIQGADINRAMIKQGSEIASSATARGYSDIGYDNAGKLANQFLDNSAGDHIAVHDAITADPNAAAGTAARQAADRMGVTCNDNGHYYGDSHVVGILQHKWAPDEHGAENMFKWIGNASQQPPDSFINNQGGEAANSLAHTLSAHSDTLAHNMPGQDGNSLGDVNPGVTRAIAGSMVPYIGNFAGLGNDMTINHTAQAFTHGSDLSKMFSVLDSDPTAATTLNVGAGQWRDYMAYQAGMHPLLSEDLGKNYGQLGHAMQTGLQTEIDNVGKTHAWHDTENYTNATKEYDAITGWANTLPGVSAINGPFRGIVEDWAKGEMIPNPGDPTHLSNDDVTNRLNSLKNSVTDDRFRAEYAQFAGYAHTHSGPDAILTNPDTGQPMPTDWNSALQNQRAFNNAYGQWEPSVGENNHGPRMRFDAGVDAYKEDDNIVEMGTDPTANTRPPQGPR